MTSILWLTVGIVLGVVFDQFFTRVWKFIKARSKKALADIED